MKKKNSLRLATLIIAVGSAYALGWLTGYEHGARQVLEAFK